MHHPHPPPQLLEAHPPVLVGRAREQTRLRAVLADALAGHGHLVLIGGEAGIGKTLLAEELGRSAVAQGARFLVGRCYDLAETPPYGPWRELFARWRDADRSALPAVFAPHETDASVTSRVALFTQGAEFLTAQAAHRPLVILLDDVHWADPATLDLLRFLARHLADQPLLVLATYRTDELTQHHPLTTLLPALVREAQALRLDLRPLEEEAICALTRQRYGLPAGDDDRLVAYLRQQAEGNPFYIGELLRTLEEERVLQPEDTSWQLGDLTEVPLPPLLRQLIDGRVARLGTEAERLLALAAVIGQEVPLALWAMVAGADEDTVLGTLERAVDAHLLAGTAAGARFAHALVREALYARLLPVRRRGLHRRVAEALLAEPSPDPDAVAYHLRQAGDPRAAEWLMRAGERAEHAYAWLTAAERYEAALALLEPQGASPATRAWLRFRLATLRRYTHAPEALQHAEAAARLAGVAGGRALAGAATFLAGNLRCIVGEPSRGIAQMEAGLAALAALPESERALPGGPGPLDPIDRWGTVVQWLGRTGRYAEARALGDRYLATAPDVAAADGLGGRPYADAHQGLAEVAAGLGRPEEAGRLHARARELNHAIGHHMMVGFAAEIELLTVAVTYRADRPAERRRLLAEAEAAYARASGVQAGPAAARAQIWPLLLDGRWDAARQVAQGALDSQLGSRTLHAIVFHLALGHLARAQGEPDRGWEFVRASFPAGPATEPGDLHFPYGLAMQQLAAALAVDAHDLPTVRAWLSAHGRWLRWSGATLGQAAGHLGWAAYHRTAGNLDVARHHAEQALAHATAPRQPLALLAAHRLLGELATTAGQHTEAAAHLDQALALADACAAPYERALTLLALAELRLATGSHTEAQAALDEALPILTRLEARPALARGASLVARMGARPAAPPARPATPAGLSAREMEVLHLLVRGATDPEIGRELSISVKTVNKHVASILGKTGCPNRTAAAAFALRHHVVASSAPGATLPNGESRPLGREGGRA